jgi:hypothetical protein
VTAITTERYEGDGAPATRGSIPKRGQRAGALPVAVEVPHPGTSFQFVRPLVLNEETKVTFSYKSNSSVDYLPVRRSP